MEKVLTVSRQAQGQRLDKFLAQQLSYLSRTKIHNLIDQGLVLVEGKERKASFHLQSGQKISVVVKEEKKELKPFEFEVKIIYEDNDIIVVDKPGGLTTHPPQAGYNETLVNALLYMKKELFIADELRPGIVHRLDKETSGVMVLTKNEHSYFDLVKQFKARKIKKEYRAICWGVVRRDHFNIDLPLGRDKKNRLKMRISFLRSKQALTEINVLERFKDSTLLALKIFTGRMHQIRVHLNFLDHPVVGDKKYGKKDKYDNLFLHAHKLGFKHPSTRKFIEFKSEVPERFKRFSEERQCTK